MKIKAFVLFSLSCILLSANLTSQAQISFLQVPTYSGDWDVFVADFNGDGKPDLITQDGTVSLGNGDGTFAAATNISDAGPFVVAVADFNGDGRPDVLEHPRNSWESALQVLFGNGDGTFRTSGVITGIQQGTVGDMNGDGKADVVALLNTTSDSTLYIYLGKGDGTFQTALSYNLGSTVAWGVISLGDFNGDNKIDIVVSAPEQELVFLGNGDGTVQPPIMSAGISHPQDATVGDFNNDGKLDLALSGAVLMGNGDGTFQVLISTSALGTAGDFNGDRKLDMAYRSHVYLGNGDGTFSDTGRAYLTQSDSNTAIADFDGDGKLDIATGNTVLLGKGDGTFYGNPSSVGAVTDLEEWDVVTGDFDNNGSIDVAVSSLWDVPILINDGTGQLSVKQTYDVQLGYDNAIVSGDFNGDGNPDLIVVTNQPNGEDGWIWSYSVLLGNGDGSFQPVFYPMGNSSTSGRPGVVVDDFNEDGKLDFEVSLWDSLFLGNGDGTFAAPIEGQVVSSLRGDFNGDGILDVVVFHSTTSSTSTGLQFGNGDGTFQTPFFPPELQGLVANFVVDLNNDGRPDLVCYTPNYVSQVALGNGDGTFAMLLPLSNDIAAIADLNGDGRPDAVYQAAGNNNMVETGVMLGNGDGTFGLPENVFANANSEYRRVLVADMNSDHRPDLVFVAHEVGVLVNTTQPGFVLSASALSPAILTAGNSATSTVSVIPTFGFNTAVALSCAGLPTGTTCAFNPPTVANSAGISALTIATSSSMAASTYPIQVQGTAGSVVNSKALSLVIQDVPDFSFGPAKSSSTSQTVAAGQEASFVLELSPSSSFTGTVNFTCAITPAVSRAPTCSVPSSIQVGSSASQSVNVSVGTTAPVASSASLRLGLPRISSRAFWGCMLLGAALLCCLNRKRISAFATAIVVMTGVGLAACGGDSVAPDSSHMTTGTPTGIYTATIIASSGALGHTTTLTVIVR